MTVPERNVVKFITKETALYTASWFICKVDFDSLMQLEYTNGSKMDQGFRGSRDSAQVHLPLLLRQS